jgi:flagellar FliL protein
MPPIRTDPTARPDEAAPAAPAPARARFAAGRFTAWLPLLLTVLLMPVLAYAMTTFVLLPRLQQGLSVAAAGNPEVDARKTASGNRKESVMMNKLLVNVAGTMGSRYLLVSLAMSGADPDFRNKVQEVEPQLRDMACGALATKTLADLEKPGARNLIRSELISGFNSILGGTVVQEIFLTEFAIQ